MLKSYFTTAWRSLWNSKGYSALTILGLSVSLGIGVLLLWWVKDEFSFDRFHQKGDQIYQLNAGLGTGSNASSTSFNVAPVAVYAKRQVPGVREAVRVSEGNDLSPVKVTDKTLIEEQAAYVDPAFFTLFDFEWVQGSRARPFPNAQSVVMTESAARRYFGNANPVGKLVYSVPKKRSYVVSGLIRDFPDNSSLKYSLLFPFADFVRDYQANEYWKSVESDWGNWTVHTYLLVDPQVSTTTIAQTLTALHHRNNKYDQSMNYRLQSLKDVHLHGPESGSSAMQQVQIMLVIALMLLSVGCINYVNLSTARAAQRAKEVSVRKFVGASRRHLIGQFLAESFVIFIISLVLAIALVKAIEPIYQQLSGRVQSFSLLNPQVWLVLIGVLLITLLLAGLYPALILSSFNPLKVLQGNVSVGGRNGSFRQVLVVTQFVLSTALIISTLVIGNQLRFIRERSLGYDRENVFAFWMTDEVAKHYEALKNDLSGQQGIVSVTSASNDLLNNQNSTGDTDWDGKLKSSTFIVHPLTVEKDFIQTFRLKLVAGEPFTGSKADSTHFILNETAVKNAGIKNPIGKRFKLHNIEGTIIGVLKDFHFTSLRQRVEPTIFSYLPNLNFGRTYVRTTGRDAAQAIASVERLWKRYSPDHPFVYRFLDEDYNRMYQSEQQTGQLFSFFAGVAILVSCLGLFGLAMFTAQQRTKEIGVRKVLGASIGSIVTLLSRDFLKLVLIAIVIASPIAYYAMNRWLQDFAYKIDIEWWVFALAGLLAVSIALLTVSFQSIKAALMNPVKSLRTE